MTQYKLDFVAVGPFKTATTWMHTYLGNHEQVSLPTTVKETYFFNRQDKYDKGYDWFFSNFDLKDEDKLVGEFAPAYFTSKVSTQRIYELNSHCTILVSLREPISQLTSFYLHKLSRGELAEGTTFKQALEQKQDLLDNVRYYTHLSRWIEAFGRDNIKIIFYDLLKENPQEFAGNLCQALGIQSLKIPEKVNKKIGENQANVNLQLTKFIKNTSYFLQEKNLYWIINIAKKMGGRRLMYKPNNTYYKPSIQEANLVLELLAEEIKNLETKLELNIDKWRKTWQEYGIVDY